jgi:serine/threonine protein kinase
VHKNVVIYTTKHFHFWNEPAIIISGSYLATPIPLSKRMPTTTQTLQKGRFSIEQELSSNGTCIHFQAYDTEGEEAVSILEIVPQLPKVATVSKREALEAAFAAKARTVSHLKQRALPAVLGSFIEGGRYYVVTPCVAGTDLLSISNNQEKAFSTNQLTDWADSLLEALTGLHYSRPPIVYGSLHPANVLVSQEGAVILSISGLFHNDEPDPASKNLAVGGSAIAFSPLEQIWNGLDAASQKVIINQYDEASERILKQELDARSDIYSLGATLYFIATGRIPVDALERSIEIIEGNPDPLVSPNKLDASIPSEVSDVIMKAMEIRREYRFDSAAIMRQVLRTALIRVKEREADVSTPVSVIAPPVRSETVRSNHVKTGPSNEFARRLSEVEEKRPATEGSLAEAETKLLEAEEAQARTTEGFNLSQLDDDVLGLLDSMLPNSSKASVVESPATGFSSAEQHSEQEIDVTSILDRVASEAVEEDLTEVAIPAEAEGSVPNDRLSHEARTNTNGPQSESTETFGSLSSVPDDEIEISFENVTGQSKNSFPFGVPMIAVAAALVCIVAVGGWLMFRGGAAPEAAITIQAHPAPGDEKQPEQPAQSAYQPDETSQTSPEISSEAPPAGADQAVTQPDRTPPSKTKKAAPAKTPPPKKAVTVDDLINDN